MAKQAEIVRLSLVARSGRSPIFIGWSESGPICSPVLSEDAAKDFQSAKQSGTGFPSLPSAGVTCFEYSSLGSATDYPGSKEDVLAINAKGEDGRAVTLNVGEFTVLKAIDWSLQEDNIWNSITGIDLMSDGSGVNSTIQMYTLLFQDSRVLGGSLCALLFKPLIRGSSNQDTFVRFMRNVIKQLLVIDESQPPKTRKGYILVASKASRSGPKTGLTDLIFDTGDAETAKALNNAKANGMKLLRTLGIAEVEDEIIEAVRNPLPNYNVDKLDIDGLIDLISAMKELAPYRNRS